MSNHNGAGTNPVMNYGKFSGGEIPPEAPEGEWVMTFERGKQKAKVNNSGFEMASFTLRLDEADSPENEAFHGTRLFTNITFHPDGTTVDKNGKAVKPFVIKINRTAYQNLCRAAGLDLSIVSDLTGDAEKDLGALVEALDGKSVTAWTTHRRDKQDGSIRVEVSFVKPGSFSGSNTSSRSDDDE